MKSYKAKKPEEEERKKNQKMVDGGVKYRKIAITHHIKLDLLHIKCNNSI